MHLLSQLVKKRNIMKNFKYKYLVVAAAFLVMGGGGRAMAQDNLMLSAHNVPQNLLVNPALAPETGFYAFPFLSGLSVGVENSFSYNSTITRIDGVKYVDNDKLTRALRGKNLTMARFNMDIINFGVRATENDYIGVSLRLRVHSANKLPGGLFDFVLDNPIGGTNKTFDIGVATNTMAWMELGASYTRKIDNNWTVGARLKLLSGLAGASSPGFGFDMTRNGADYLVSGRGMVRLGNINANSNDLATDMMNNLGSNFGVGADIGASYVSDDKTWSVNASISDFGAIFWNASNSSQISVRDNGTQYKFEGIGNIKDLMGGGLAMGPLVDSVFNEFSKSVGIDTVSGVGYTGYLPTTFQVMGTYAIDKNMRHNVNLGMIGSLAYSHKFQYAISAGYVYRTMNGRWQLMANYTFKPRDPVGVGVGFVYTGHKFQAFLSTDNIIPAFSWTAAKSANVRLGINFMFGK